MEKGTISLSKEEQVRLRVLNMVLLGDLTGVQAAERLGLSLRQFRRLLARYKEGGAAAVAHGNRGRKPAIAVSEETCKYVLEVAAQPLYANCNDTHFTELLAEREGVALSRSTIRRLLRGAGRPAARKHRPPRYRKRRERAPRAGLLLQIDASFHPWFEKRGPRCVLVAGIDDATGTVPSAHFRAQEDTDGYFVMLADILQHRGIPGSLYHDGRGTFILLRASPTLQEQLEGVVPQTQFARAAEDLGIAMIHARSPQAKGRIERLWQTLQDRLVIELRLAEIDTIEAANAFLPRFLHSFNLQFGQPPEESDSGYVPIPPNLDIAAVCCCHFERTVASDNTITVKGVRLQLPAGPQGRSYRGQKVTAQRRLDGTWAVKTLDRLHHPVSLAPAPPLKPPVPEKAPPVRPGTVPGPTHPWRQYKIARNDPN